MRIDQLFRKTLPASTPTSSIRMVRRPGSEHDTWSAAMRQQYVRKQLGIELEGRGRISQQRRSSSAARPFSRNCRSGPAAIITPVRMIVVQDDLDTSCEYKFSHGPAPAVLLQGTFFESTFRFEVLNVAVWHQNLLVAERFRSTSVSCWRCPFHLVIPTGGLGDEHRRRRCDDLSWKLAETSPAGADRICSHSMSWSVARSAS